MRPGDNAAWLASPAVTVVTWVVTEPPLFLAQVEKENFVVQELKNHLHQVLKFSENSLFRTKQEAEKQQKADFRASQARVAKIQQDILQLRSQYHNLVMENREAEQALRKVPGEQGGGDYGAAGQGTGRREVPSRPGSPGLSQCPLGGRRVQHTGPGAGDRETGSRPAAACPLCDLGQVP